MVGRGGGGGGWGHVICVIMTHCVRKSMGDSPLIKMMIFFSSCRTTTADGNTAKLSMHEDRSAKHEWHLKTVIIRNY